MGKPKETEEQLWDMTFECSRCGAWRYITVAANSEAEALEKGKIEHPCHDYKFKEWGRE